MLGVKHVSLGKEPMSRLFRILLAVIFSIGASSMAHAQVEVGSSLARLSIGDAPLADYDTNYTALSLPSAVGIDFQPGVYAAFFVTPHVAVEPQMSLVWQHGGGMSSHALNLAGQADYFLGGSNRSSPFVLGAVGLVDYGGNRTPKTVAGGVGYRWRLGDRLTVRTDGRFTHVTLGGGTAFTFSLSIGGLFGH
jgi:hypothetical protein